MRKNYSFKAIVPALLLAVAPVATANAQGGNTATTSASASATEPADFVKASANMLGTTTGTVPEGWTLSFPDADESRYDELAAGVRCATGYSTPQMEKGVFVSSPKETTRLVRVIPLADLGITTEMLKEYANAQKLVSLYFSCDAETSYTSAINENNAEVRFRGRLLREDGGPAGSSMSILHLYQGGSAGHLFGETFFTIVPEQQPVSVELLIDMLPCKDAVDIADEGITLGNVRFYVGSCEAGVDGRYLTRDIEVNSDYSGTTIGAGRYLSMGAGESGSTAHIVFEGASKFTLAKLKDAAGNVVATSNNDGTNTACFDIVVNDDLKTDYQLTGTPTNPDYDPEDPEAPDNGLITFTLELEGATPSGINGVKADEKNNTAQKRVYNIAGQRVNTTQPGTIYVVDGKKVVK